MLETTTLHGLLSHCIERHHMPLSPIATRQRLVMLVLVSVLVLADVSVCSSGRNNYCYCNFFVNTIKASQKYVLIYFEN